MGGIPAAVEMPLRPHEDYRDCGQHCVESPGETALGTCERIVAAPEAFSDVETRSSHAAKDLIVRSCQVVDGRQVSGRLRSPIRERREAVELEQRGLLPVTVPLVGGTRLPAIKYRLVHPLIIRSAYN
jgi:hypothetical protein